MKFYKPTYGETREIKKFAWYPISIGGVVCWLETIIIHQRYDGKSWVNGWVVETMHKK